MPDPSHPTRRYLSLSLPRLPIERRRPARPGTPAADARPLVVADMVHNAMRLVVVDRVAAARGLHPGLTLADARARRPDLDMLEPEPETDEAAARALADWATRYTPLVGRDGPFGLVLDITGCAHLFGGEEGLLADLRARLERRGLTVLAAIAATPAAARAVASHGGGGVVASAETERALLPLPVRALAIDDDTAAALERLGLKRVAQIAGMARAPLAARFGRGLLDALDRALGRAEESISPLRPAPVFSAERVFAEPLRDLEALDQVVTALAFRLAEPLARHDQGARRLSLSLYRTDGAVLPVELGLARPSRDPETIGRLFASRIEAFHQGLDTGEGLDLVRLSVEETDGLVDEQVDLEGRLALSHEVDRLADRLGARLGASRLVRLVPGDSHLPERAAARGGASRAVAWPLPEPDPERTPERPLRLFDRPEPVEAIAEVPDGPPMRFRWRHVQREVVRCEGPERISPEWWRGGEEALTRDYFRVEDRAGRRYWLYRAGLYGRETGQPRWYLHGLFA